MKVSQYTAEAKTNSHISGFVGNTDSMGGEAVFGLSQSYSVTLSQCYNVTVIESLQCYTVTYSAVQWCEFKSEK